MILITAFQTNISSTVVLQQGATIRDFRLLTPEITREQPWPTGVRCRQNLEICGIYAIYVEKKYLDVVYSIADADDFEPQEVVNTPATTDKWDGEDEDFEAKVSMRFLVPYGVIVKFWQM